MSKTYTMQDYLPFVRRDNKPLPLPNAEDVNPLWFLNSMAAVGHGWTPVWGFTVLPDGSRPQWSMLFLDMVGGGYAVTYGGQKWADGKATELPIVRKFQICKHEVVEGPGANHSRGWHPGKCKHCGMDMSYDSGD